MTHNQYAPPEASVGDVSPTGAEIVRPGGRQIAISFDDLTKRDQWRLFWGFMWRGLVTTLISMLGGLALSILVGIILGTLARFASIEAYDIGWMQKVIGFVCGTAVGLIMSWKLIRWYFRANWLGYRLALIRDDA